MHRHSEKNAAPYHVIQEIQWLYFQYVLMKAANIAPKQFSLKLSDINVTSALNARCYF